MKKRTKEEMTAYQKERRNRVTPIVTPAKNVTPKVVTPVKCNTPPVTPIASSLQEEYELRLKILRGRVAILERELGEVKKLLPKKTDSPYRGF